MDRPPEIEMDMHFYTSGKQFCISKEKKNKVIPEVIEARYTKLNGMKMGNRTNFTVQKTNVSMIRKAQKTFHIWCTATLVTLENDLTVALTDLLLTE